MASQSIITNTLNHISDAAVTSGIMGGIGYLCARSVTYMSSTSTLDPRVGLVAGAAAGFITGIFFAERSNDSSNLIGLAALGFVPYRICQRKEIPTTFVVALSLTVASLAIYQIAREILNRLTD